MRASSGWAVRAGVLEGRCQLDKCNVVSSIAMKQGCLDWCADVSGGVGGQSDCSGEVAFVSIGVLSNSPCSEHPVGFSDVVGVLSRRDFASELPEKSGRGDRVGSCQSSNGTPP